MDEFESLDVDPIRLTDVQLKDDPRRGKNGANACKGGVERNIVTIIDDFLYLPEEMDL